MWHYECNGQSVGPVSEETIDVLIKDGIVERETVVWKKGMDDWEPAEQTELRTRFVTPPPLNSSNAPRLPPESILTMPELSGADVNYGTNESTATEDSRGQENNKLSAPACVEMGTFAKPLKGVWNHSRVAVFVYLFASALVILSYLVSIDFVQGVTSGSLSQAEINERADFVDSFSGLSNLGFLIVFIWSAIVIGRWTYRAMSNLRKSGIETTVSPGWAIGWHFIPVALLWMPFRGMAQIWRGSINLDALGNTSVPSSMRFWWAAWIIGNSASFLSFRLEELGLSSGNFVQVQAGMAVGIFASASHMLAAVLLLGLTKQVSLAQDSNPASEFS